MKQRDKFHSRKDWNQYKYWRNKLTALLRISKGNFFFSRFHDQLKKTRITPFCGDILKDDRKIPDEILIDDNTYHVKNDVIEQLNDFFTTISDRLKSNDTQNHDTVNYDFKTLKDYVDSKVPSEIKFKIPFMKSSELVNALESQDIKNTLDWTQNS